MSEETKTKIIGRADGLQCRPESEILEEIQGLEEDEATLFSCRGYGGYINSTEIENIRKAKEDCCAELSAGHPKKISEAKERSRRTSR